MPNIIFDSRLVKALECLRYLADFAGKDSGYTDKLWAGFLDDGLLLEEFMYYVDNKTFKDKYKIAGYGLTDLYFFNMRNVEIKQDIGKNYADCNKEALALDTFMTMLEMKADPGKYIRWLDKGPGMDRFYD